MEGRIRECSPPIFVVSPTIMFFLALYLTHLTTWVLATSVAIRRRGGPRPYLQQGHGPNPRAVAFMTYSSTGRAW